MEAGLVFGRIKQQRTSGTTFIELMVSSTIFLLLMGVIMSFYISGAKVTRQQDQRSDTMRRALNIADKFEILLSNSRLIWSGVKDSGDKPQILVFTPLDTSASPPITAKGVKWSRKAETIYYDANSKAPQFIHINGEGNERPLGRLKLGEKAILTVTKNSVTLRLELLYYPHSVQPVSEEIPIYIHERTIPIVNCDDF